MGSTSDRRADDPQRQLAAAAAYLEGLIDLEKQRAPRRARLSLAPIRALLERLGGPERGLRVVHVAGSKGKGSTALFAEAVLRAAGSRVATFTSPHLERWTERFRVDGEEIAPQRLAAAVERLRPHVEALRAAGGDTVPTFFDATTAAALCLFRELRVDHAVLEVGLGGRLDSTSAAEPSVCCITSIELEHTEILGGTLAAIAGEKAGILKPGVPAVCGDLPPDALAVVERRAAELACPLARIGREIEVAVDAQDGAPDRSRLHYREGDLCFTASLRVPGAHQAANAALAVAAARRALDSRLAPERFAAAARAGLESARLPARVEILERAPWVVVDAAHTGASARALAAVLAALGRPVDFVLSISAGKDTRAILAALLPLARSLVLTRAEPVRSLEPAELAAAVHAERPGLAVRVVPDPELALRGARAALGADALLCATGSVYLAGIARRVLRAHAPERAAG